MIYWCYREAEVWYADIWYITYRDMLTEKVKATTKWNGYLER